MASRKLELPRRERRYTFSLTPLADAMFQLLIFFMLSSSLTPYSLITVKSGAAAEAPTPVAGTTAGREPAPQPPDVDISSYQWTLRPGRISTGGDDWTFDRLPTLAETLAAQPDPLPVNLLVGSDARVQDLTTVLAILRRSDIDDVAVGRSPD